jgi:hypothetical protein
MMMNDDEREREREAESLPALEANVGLYSQSSAVRNLKVDEETVSVQDGRHGLGVTLMDVKRNFFQNAIEKNSSVTQYLVLGEEVSPEFLRRLIRPPH